VSELTEALLQHIHSRQLSGKATALATIISTKGSTPCKAGAKMLVFPDGGAYGTIGGGCAEAEVKMKALSVLDDGVACTISVWLLDDDAAQNGMVCGGTMNVFIQVV
jgi:xanthine dehydrogenase accessory factor